MDGPGRISGFFGGADLLLAGSARMGINAKSQGCKGPARQAATKDGFAAKELKEHKGN